jgi:hypothetical protein
MVQLLAASVCLMLVIFNGNGFASTVEIATGPDGLLQMEQEGKVTVRALRGWGRLPDEYVKLAQRMRQESGLDLLGADLVQVRQWSADPALAQFGAELAKLAAFMEGGEHLDWSPPASDAPVPAGTLVRSGGTRWAQAADGPVEVPSAVRTEPVQAEPVQAALPPAAPSDTGPQDGLEFPVNDQVSGTFRVKLRVEGLREATPAEEPWLERAAPRLKPGNPDVVARERGYFEKRASYLPDPGLLAGAESAYDLFLGVATPGTPVVIRVDAPENPAVALSELDVRENVSYRARKSVLFFRLDDAEGDADIDFKEDMDGLASWTPRVDPGTGRPVGPRAVGVYMAYKVRKFMGERELGTLSYNYKRIGWVMVAMPGDVYEHEGALYAVGRDEPLTAQGASDLPPAPEAFDFQLPQYALDEGAIKLSDDVRHVAWVEGEKDGKKRVVVNGVPGKWYDDVKGYALRFSSGGETLCFEVEFGDKEVPVCNGADGPLFDDLEFLRLSPDGSHVLVAGKVDGVYRVFLNGEQVRQTPHRMWEGTVSWNGKGAWIERGRDEQTGAEFARMVTSDGTEGVAYPAIHGAPLFTQNRAELYYIAGKEDGNRFLVRDTEELKPTMGSGYQFRVTDDGAYYAYVAQLGDNEESMVVNGRIGPDFERIWSPAVFSADGSRHIYEGKKGDEAFLVIDEQVHSHDFGPLKGVVGETFSPDGQRWAAGFQLNAEDYVVVVDGKEVGRGQGSPRQIVFSPDGTRVAWFEKQKKSWRAYLDGKAGPEVREIFDDAPPQFSPDGRHLVYFTGDKDKKMHIVVFGGEDRVHDIIPPRAMFVKGGLEYLAIDGTHFRRESIALD